MHDAESSVRDPCRCKRYTCTSIDGCIHFFRGKPARQVGGGYAWPKGDWPGQETTPRVEGFTGRYLATPGSMISMLSSFSGRSDRLLPLRILPSPNVLATGRSGSHGPRSEPFSLQTRRARGSRPTSRRLEAIADFDEVAWYHAECPRAVVLLLRDQDEFEGRFRSSDSCPGW